MSDFDMCKLYHRLAEENIRYLVIDPNILSVMMGEGNDSLKDRMFGKINEATKMIAQDGVMTMIAKMTSQGYLDLEMSNNLLAIYAFTYDDAEFIKTISEAMISPQSKEYLLTRATKDMPQLRAKMALSRFFPEVYRPSVELAQYLLQKRAQNGKVVNDIAWIFGKVIEKQNIFTALQKYQKNPSQTDEYINETLTQDERFVFTQYLMLYNALTS